MFKYLFFARSKMLRVFFISCLILILNFNFFIYPAHAFSTIDACMRQAKCAATFVGQTGAKTSLKQGASITSATIKVSGGNGVKNSVSVGALGLLGLSFSGDTLFSKLFDQSSVQAIEDIILEKYCQTNSCVGATWGVDAMNVYGNTTLTTSYDLQWTGDKNLSFISRGGYVDIYSPDGLKISTLQQKNGQTEYLKYQLISQGTTVDDIDKNTKDALIDSLSLEDYLVDKSISSGIAAGDIITLEDENGNKLPFIATDGFDVFTTDELIVDEADVDGTNDVTEEDIAEKEQDEILESIENIELIEPQEFKGNQTWIAYAITAFSNKFPFDIFGDISSGGSTNVCPSYVFFDRTYELCPIRDLIVMFKYPAIISYLIWSYQTL